MSAEPILKHLPLLLSAAAISFSLWASIHAVLHKRDPRAAVSWTGLIWLVPFGGAFLYASFGVNRIQRRAHKLRRARKALERRQASEICDDEELRALLGPGDASLAAVARAAGTLTGRPLLEGNEIRMLVNGEQAYPEMLRAIGEARRSVAVLAYIFELDELGRRFVDALVAAQKRGCQVRVLVDYVGSHRAVVRALQAEGVPAAVFLPPKLLPLRNRYMNLRNHRKIVVCDGRHGFTGGMNIRRSHLVETPQEHYEQDTHFQLRGPVVDHLLEAFADDWAFATGESLVGADWYGAETGTGPAVARGIPYDPGENLDILRLVYAAAFASAKKSIRLVTPYFLPEQPIITALNLAALRGVRVDIVIPEQNDSLVVDWACRAMLWQVLVHGCRVWRSKPPFDHSKLLVVDEALVILGSANMDTRSMRLNFEFNVEVYDKALASEVERHIGAKLAGAREVTLKEMDGRRFAIRLRDGVAKLFSPYL